jgi:hypothetical protein
MTFDERFWAKVEKTDSCWLWTGSTRSAYGTFWNGQRAANAHRVAYELLVGPIPEGLELDHLCRVPTCVNPAHLEPVTHAENVRRGNGWGGRHSRKTHCYQGHPFSGTNLIIDARGYRVCRTCRDRNNREGYERRKQVAA